MISPQDAAGDLYRMAVVEGKTTSTARMQMFSGYCVQELEDRGLQNAVILRIATAVRASSFC